MTYVFCAWDSFRSTRLAVKGAEGSSTTPVKEECKWDYPGCREPDFLEPCAFCMERRAHGRCWEAAGGLPPDEGRREAWVLAVGPCCSVECTLNSLKRYLMDGGGKNAAMKRVERMWRESLEAKLAEVRRSGRAREESPAPVGRSAAGSTPEATPSRRRPEAGGGLAQETPQSQEMRVEEPVVAQPSTGPIAMDLQEAGTGEDAPGAVVAVMEDAGEGAAAVSAAREDLVETAARGPGKRLKRLDGSPGAPPKSGASIAANKLERGQEGGKETVGRTAGAGSAGAVEDGELSRVQGRGDRQPGDRQPAPVQAAAEGPSVAKEGPKRKAEAEAEAAEEGNIEPKVPRTEGKAGKKGGGKGGAGSSEGEFFEYKAAPLADFQKKSWHDDSGEDGVRFAYGALLDHVMSTESINKLSVDGLHQVWYRDLLKRAAAYTSVASVGVINHRQPDRMATRPFVEERVRELTALFDPRECRPAVVVVADTLEGAEGRGGAGWTAEHEWFGRSLKRAWLEGDPTPLFKALEGRSDAGRSDGGVPEGGRPVGPHVFTVVGNHSTAAAANKQQPCRKAYVYFQSQLSIAEFVFLSKTENDISKAAASTTAGYEEYNKPSKLIPFLRDIWIRHNRPIAQKGTSPEYARYLTDLNGSLENSTAAVKLDNKGRAWFTHGTYVEEYNKKKEAAEAIVDAQQRRTAMQEVRAPRLARVVMDSAWRRMRLRDSALFRFANPLCPFRTLRVRDRARVLPARSFARRADCG